MTTPTPPSDPSPTQPLYPVTLTGTAMLNLHGAVAMHLSHPSAARHFPDLPRLLPRIPGTAGQVFSQGMRERVLHLSRPEMEQVCGCVAGGIGMIHRHLPRDRVTLAMLADLEHILTQITAVHPDPVTLAGGTAATLALLWGTEARHGQGRGAGGQA